MRWSDQGIRVDDGALPGLQRIGFVRTVRTPQFEGITFHEVLCKSALNKVPDAAMLPFQFTVNGYRGCATRAATASPGPPTSTSSSIPGPDFDTQIVVKTNVVEVLRRELARPSWQRETVALGTNTDPYQRAEGRYALMPGIIGALAESGTPLSILTKGTLLRRDLPLIADAAQQVPMSVAVSLAVGDPDLHRDVEPGTPSPQARLGLITAIRDAGLDCHVMVAPVLPQLTDSVEHLDRLLGADRRRRAPPGSPCSGCTCAARRGAGSWAGWRARIPNWSRPTGSCTGAVPTCLRTTATCCDDRADTAGRQARARRGPSVLRLRPHPPPSAPAAEPAAQLVLARGRA